jgi:hypothetical protein
MLILLMVLRPQGLLGSREISWQRLLRKRAAAPKPEAA